LDEKELKKQIRDKDKQIMGIIGLLDHLIKKHKIPSEIQKLDKKIIDKIPKKLKK